MNHQPLVSIVVITYNSSQYVLETLESARVQTYQNIELIVSDDCSTDDTMDVCRNWLNKNEERFVRTELLSVPQNTGISANCNRGYKAAKGEWIKGIAGDDALLPDCIFDNILYCNQNLEIKVVHSAALYYKDIFDGSYLIKKHSLVNHIIQLEGIKAIDQYRLLLRGNQICSPTLFFHRDIFEDFQFDEGFPGIEDFPFLLNLTRNNIKLWYMDICTVNYRVRDNSISNIRREKKIYPPFFEIKWSMDKIYVFPYISLIECIFKNIDYYYKKNVNKLSINRTKYIYMFFQLGRLPVIIFNMINIWILKKSIKNI
jgi:alpha-1,3-rhamnosyltransferase